MRFFDAWKIAFHNMRVNKSRTILTIFIVLIVSSLMMTLCLFGISFYENQLKFNKNIFERGGTQYNLNEKRTYDGENLGISAEELSVLDSVSEKYKHVINKKYYLPYGGNTKINYEYSMAAGLGEDEVSSEEISENLTEENGVTADERVEVRLQLADFSMYDYPGKNVIAEGRIWTKEDIRKNGIWVSEDAVKDFAKKGVTLNIGDAIALVRSKLKIDEFGDAEFAGKQLTTFIVRGFFDKNAAVTEGEFIDNYVEVDYIVDCRYYLEKFSFSETAVGSAIMTYCPPKADYDYNSVYKSMESFYEEMNEKIAPNESSYGKSERFSCYYVEQLVGTKLVSAVIAGLIASLAFIVLLLSVGSVANTIMISVDKNRKFIGLMKALGLNQRDVKKIVSFESLFLIVVGVLLGILVLFLVRPAVASAMRSLFAFIFSYTGIDVIVSVTIPVYLPVVTAAAFFLFAMLFSRGALTGIAKQDAIATINEVA